ncbi:hypothetical protein [Methylocella sp.]|uniref:hypothetical protein n=1 Tax=Methylocella sp. TaxID=1978226 RepID=UPI0035B2C011
MRFAGAGTEIVALIGLIAIIAFPAAIKMLRELIRRNVFIRDGIDRIRAQKDTYCRFARKTVFVCGIFLLAFMSAFLFSSSYEVMRSPKVEEVSSAAGAAFSSAEDPGWPTTETRPIFLSRQRSIDIPPPAFTVVQNSREPTTPRQRPTFRPKHGCGSRGGPGYRLPNGQCASWSKQH